MRVHHVGAGHVPAGRGGRDVPISLAGMRRVSDTDRVAASITERQESAVTAAMARLTQRFPDLVKTVFSYGATDIDPKHLVVWVLLAGPAEAIPAWLFPPTGSEWHLDESRTPEQRELIRLILEMAAGVRDCFREAGWPDADHVSVGFDSAERVESKGGWTYFK
jgi:hypothetical protein